jgi:hypothetical protein
MGFHLVAVVYYNKTQHTSHKITQRSNETLYMDRIIGLYRGTLLLLLLFILTANGFSPGGSGIL